MTSDINLSDSTEVKNDCKLAPELIALIISHLTDYQTLTTLCQVSQVIRRLTLPTLYNTIRLFKPSHYVAFYKSITPQSTVTQTLEESEKDIRLRLSLVRHLMTEFSSSLGAEPELLLEVDKKEIRPVLSSLKLDTWCLRCFGPRTEVLDVTYTPSLQPDFDKYIKSKCLASKVPFPFDGDDGGDESSKTAVPRTVRLRTYRGDFLILTLRISAHHETKHILFQEIPTPTYYSTSPPNVNVNVNDSSQLPIIDTKTPFLESDYLPMPRWKGLETAQSCGYDFPNLLISMQGFRRNSISNTSLGDISTGPLETLFSSSNVSTVEDPSPGRTVLIQPTKSSSSALTLSETSTRPVRQLRIKLEESRLSEENYHSTLSWFALSLIKPSLLPPKSKDNISTTVLAYRIITDAGRESLREKAEVGEDWGIVVDELGKRVEMVEDEDEESPEDPDDWAKWVMQKRN